MKHVVTERPLITRRKYPLDTTSQSIFKETKKQQVTIEDLRNKEKQAYRYIIT